MWLAFLRRLVVGKSRSAESKKTRQQRRRTVPRLEHLENRIVPTTVLNAGTTSELITDIGLANSNSSASNPYQINLTSSSYSFSSAYNSTANVLPVISAANLTIVGNSSTNGSILDAKSFGRLFDVASGASVTLIDMTLTGGMASGSTAQGGAVYNSGQLTMKTVIVGGNSAVGGSGQNAEGGGIYSNGGSLTLVNDIIGHKTVIHRTISATKSTKTTKTIGGANKAIGGAGGSGQGAGLYIAGGTVNVTGCTFASNKASGGVNGQGGGIFANGSTLTLKNNLLGQIVTRSKNSTNKTSKSTFTGNPNSALGGAGGVGQGGGLYVSGGTVNVTNDRIWDNQVKGAIGA